MECQKLSNWISNLLDTTFDDKVLPSFATKKWIEVYDQSEENYNVNKEIRIKNSILRSDLCDFTDAYVVVNGNITLRGENDASKRNKNVAFKNNSPFIHYISRINCVQIDNAEDLDVVMSMCNLIEYDKNYRKTTGSLWNYYRGKPSNPLSSNSKSFTYKNNITGKTPDNNDVLEDIKVVVPLKYLSNFWRTLNILLINCEIKLILSWSKNCALADMAVRAAGNNNDPPAIFAATRLKFQITDTKLYVPVATMLKEND